MVGQRGDLTRRAAAGDDHVVGDFRLAGEVDRHDVLGLAVFKARKNTGQERPAAGGAGRLAPCAAPAHGKSRDRWRRPALANAVSGLLRRRSAARFGRGSRSPSADRAWCERTTQAGAVISASDGAPPRHPRRAKRCAAVPASAFSEVCGRSKTAIGTPFGSISTASAASAAIARDCRRPSARQTACAESAAAAPRSVSAV
jgi:hypothetical protein